MGRHYTRQELRDAITQDAKAKQAETPPPKATPPVCKFCGKAYVNVKAHSLKCKQRKK